VRLSVVIAAYNAEAYIKDALESVLDQSVTNLECIVIDDCSDDNTCSIVEAYCKTDSRVILRKLSSNFGPGYARNVGIEMASGDWICFLDSDDKLHNDRLEILTAIVPSGFQCVVDNQEVVDYSTGRFIKLGFDFKESNFSVSERLFFYKSLPSRRNLSTGYLKPLFNRMFLLSNNIRFPSEIRVGEDFVFFARFFGAGGKMFYTSHPGYIYRIRNESISRSNHAKLELMANSCLDLLHQNKRVYGKLSLAILLARYHILMGHFIVGEIKGLVSKRAVGEVAFLLIKPRSIISLFITVVYVLLRK